MEGEGAGNDGEEFKFEGLGIEGDDVVGALKSLLKSKFCCCCGCCSCGFGFPDEAINFV